VWLGELVGEVLRGPDSWKNKNGPHSYAAAVIDTENATVRRQGMSGDGHAMMRELTTRSSAVLALKRLPTGQSLITQYHDKGNPPCATGKPVFGAENCYDRDIERGRIERVRLFSARAGERPKGVEKASYFFAAPT